MIAVNGVPVGFDYQLRDRDKVEVYPASASPAAPPIKLRREPPEPPVFIADLNLGKLAKRLRLFGFDTLLARDMDDKGIAACAARERRIVLTRDRRLLYRKIIEHGYWVRAVRPDLQLPEVIGRFGLASFIRPFRRCTRCNGLIETVDKSRIVHLLPLKTRRFYDFFYRCGNCGRLYWEGSHIEKIKKRFAAYF